MRFESFEGDTNATDSVELVKFRRNGRGPMLDDVGVGDGLRSYYLE